MSPILAQVKMQKALDPMTLPQKYFFAFMVFL
jgi:hypothetical protein